MLVYFPRMFYLFIRYPYIYMLILIFLQWNQKEANRMNENQPSLTSIVTAYIRTYHSMHATNKIFDYFLAYSLIPKEKWVIIEQHFGWDKQLNNPDNDESGPDITNILPSLTKTNNIICRARYTEDTLEKAVSQGVKQYVILGAGLDTFVFRRSDLMGQLKVSEVDHLPHKDLNFIA